MLDELEFLFSGKEPDEGEMSNLIRMVFSQEMHADGSEIWLLAISRDTFSVTSLWAAETARAKTFRRATTPLLILPWLENPFTPLGERLPFLEFSSGLTANGEGVIRFR